MVAKVKNRRHSVKKAFLSFFKWEIGDGKFWSCNLRLGVVDAHSHPALLDIQFSSISCELDCHHS